MESIQEEKKLLRIQAKNALKTFFADKNLAFSAAKSAADIFLSSAEYKESSAIFMYMALPDELDLTSVLKKSLQDKKKVYLPRIKSGSMDMDFFEIQDEHFSFSLENAFKIKEPLETFQKIELSKIPEKSVFLIPGLAFNLEGARLGRGKGFYDKYLSGVKNLNPLKNIIFCGVCVTDVVTRRVPSGVHDVSMTHLLTESGFIKILPKELRSSYFSYSVGEDCSK